MGKNLIYLLNRCYMKIIRLLFLFSITIVILAWFSHTSNWKKTEVLYGSKRKITTIQPDNPVEKLEYKAAAARLFLQHSQFNENVCFLIDMSLPSGQKRFFIYDLKNDTLQAAGLVAHGNCYENWLEGRRYSNVVGSGCSSLGKYKIGNSYTGKFGYSYKLYGLDGTNNKAFERTVVLHSHSCVPESQVTDDICQSNGCPMVSPNLLLQLKFIINNSKKPLLLWMYE